MKRKLLIVDDNDEFRIMIRQYLEKEKMDLEIFEASTGEMAVAKSSFVKPDIVLMDIRLPHASGIEAAKHVIGDNPHCDVIILTMFEVEAFRAAAKTIHVREFIGKSEIYDRLIPVVRKCLKEKEAEVGTG